MKKRRTRKETVQVEVLEKRTVSVQMPLPMLAALEDIRAGFEGLCIEAGRQVLMGMMEHDRERLCGERWSREEKRGAQRHGHTKSLVVFGGRKIEIRRPRVRSAKLGERRLPSFAWAAAEDPLNERTMEAIACGVSTRKYRRSLDTLATEERQVATSASAVSRRFVAMSQALVDTFLSRPLHDLDIRVIMIDGIVFSEHTILIALGVRADGQKLVLGVREGTTESTAVVKGLLGDLIERGLTAEKGLLFVIDGAKGLRAGIQRTFGNLALVQRCQVHKQRNVLEHLPEKLRPLIGAAMRRAYDQTKAELAERRLKQVAQSLEREHPGAASSLAEGLSETLTLMRLGLRGALYRSLRSTNAIENLNGAAAQYTRNVRRWQGGSMIVRWVTSAISEAEKKFRRLRGHKQLPQLLAALDAHTVPKVLDKQRKAA